MFSNIKEFLKNPKKKSLLQLGLYIIFFIIVFIIIGMGETKDNGNNYIKDIEKEEKITEYNFVINLYNDNIITTITGTYDGSYNYVYNGINYICKDGITYLDNVEIDRPIDIESYSYSEIENMIESSESKTTYNDSNRTIYNINIVDYLNNNKPNIYDLMGGYLNIEVEKDKYITHAIIMSNNIKLSEIYYTNIKTE